MTLSELAIIYEQQLMDKLYFVISDSQRRVYMLNADKRNFMHLTGIQRSEEFKGLKLKRSFYDICMCNNRTVNSLTFVYRPDRNMALLKTNAFANCCKAIHNLQSIYISGNVVTCATKFLSNGKEKIFSISFSEEDDKVWRPVTVQVDKNLESSTMIVAENLSVVSQVIDLDKKVAYDAIAKSGKSLLDVRGFIINKYCPNFE